MLILDYWTRQWQTVAFDTRRGRGRVRWFSRTPDRTAGWAHKHGGVWYALWSDGANVVFQAGERQVRMTSAHRCANARIKDKRRFSIDVDGRIEFELLYKSIDRDDDPTFDLDEWDFFYFASQMLNDEQWKKDAMSDWAAGR